MTTEDPIAAPFDHEPTYSAGGGNTPTCCIGHALAATAEGPQPYRGLHRHDPSECASCAALTPPTPEPLDERRLASEVAALVSPEMVARSSEPYAQGYINAINYVLAALAARQGAEK